jgi:3',5'-cyclic AMP phosphodiesterase CpdA
VLGLTNLVLRRGRRFPEPVAQAVIRELSQEQADFVLFSGDLTTTALRREFEAGRRLLQPLLDHWNGRFIAIPGNHDRYTPRATRHRLFESLFHDANRELPFAMDLDERWSLVGFDCAVPRPLSSRGRLHPELLGRLDDILGRLQQQARHIAVMGHYPLLYPQGVKPSWEHVLPERAALLAMLNRRGVSLYLHGHSHRRWLIQADGLTHLNCGSAGMVGTSPARRPGYLRIHLGSDGSLAVQAHWLGPKPRGIDREFADWHTETLSPE